MTRPLVRDTAGQTKKLASGALDVDGNSVALLPIRLVFPGVSGQQQNSGTGAGTYLGIGAITFDPSTLFAGDGNTGVTRAVYFRVVLEGSSGVTAQIKLYNISVGEDVTGTTLSITSTSPSTTVSSALTVGAAAGNVKNSLQVYEVQLHISSPGSPVVSDIAICRLAQLEVYYS